LLRRQLAQLADSIAYYVAAARRELLHLLIDAASGLFLLRRQMLPGFHAARNPILLLRLETIEMLQTLPKLLLPLWRKSAELRITF
jgi:hypothetical protein